MNVVLLNHYAGSIYRGMEYRPYYLAREWRRHGHNVGIIAASYSHLRQANPAPRATFEEVDGIGYHWIPTSRYSGNGVGRLRNMLQFVARSYARIGRIGESLRPNAVVASSTYPLDIIAARRLANHAKARLIFEIHDLWPLTPMELGGFSRWHPFIVLMQWGEDYALRRSDAIVSMLPAASPYLESRGMRPEKFHYIPNGICVEDWKRDAIPLSGAIQQQLAGIRSNYRFLIGYTGAHGLANALEYLTACAPLVRQEGVALVLVGQGPEKVSLQSKAQEGRWTNVFFLPAVPKAEIPALLAEFDATYIGWRRRNLYRYGVNPNKLLDYMMAARPVIHAVEAENDLVQKAQCGFSLLPEDADELAAVIRRLVAMSLEDRAAMGERGRQYVCAHHDYGTLARRFEQVLFD